MKEPINLSSKLYLCLRVRPIVSEALTLVLLVALLSRALLLGVDRSTASAQLDSDAYADSDRYWTCTSMERSHTSPMASPNCPRQPWIEVPETVSHES